MLPHRQPVNPNGRMTLQDKYNVKGKEINKLRRRYIALKQAWKINSDINVSEELAKIEEQIAPLKQEAFLLHKQITSMSDVVVFDSYSPNTNK